MKRIPAFLLLLLAMCINLFAQSLSAELGKIKQIKMLESTREEANKILDGYKGEYDSVSYSETFSSAKIEIEVSYTNGNCSDNWKMWNIENGKVDFIDISFKDYVKLKDLNYDVSAFRKERLVADGKEGFIYHDKYKGIAFVVESEKVTSIFLMPSANQISLLCKNEKSKILQDFYSRESYLIKPNSSQK